MKAIINGQIVLPDQVIAGKALLFDERIVGLVDPQQIGDAQIIDAAGLNVLPGLIDMHIHGYLGEDASDGSEQGLITMAEGIVQNGVTSWLPTTMTVSRGELRAAFALIRKLMEPGNNPRGARILGVNAEGPFINPARKGAQAETHILAGDADFVREYEDVIRVVTIAPEMPGNMDCIRQIARETQILISMGHTSATYAQAKEAIEAGVRHTTHLFNAMTALNHREPGVVGAALGDDRVYTELIADNFHVNPGLFGLVVRMKGDRLVLVTDCTRAGGLADGEYTLGGQPIFVKGIECRLADGTIAGSVLKLNNALRNMREHTELPLAQIVRMATLNPARALRVDGRVGSLEAGKEADIVLADEHFGIRQTIVGGQVKYTA